MCVCLHVQPAIIGASFDECIPRHSPSAALDLDVSLYFFFFFSFVFTHRDRCRRFSSSSSYLSPPFSFLKLFLPRSALSTVPGIIDHFRAIVASACAPIFSARGAIRHQAPSGRGKRRGEREGGFQRITISFVRRTLFFTRPFKL